MDNTVYIGLILEKGEALEKGIRRGVEAYRRRFALDPNVALVNPNDLQPVAIEGISVIEDGQVRRKDILIGQESEHG